MTIDERVSDLIATFVEAAKGNSATRAAFAHSMRDALLDVAREQRLACLQAAMALDNKPDFGYRDADEVRTAILNAEVK